MTNAFTAVEFSEKFVDKKLMGSRCPTCGEIYVPPRPVCVECLTDEMAWVEVEGKGKLVAYTIIYVAPTAMLDAGYGFKNPYCTGIVELENGERISAQIVGVDVAHPESIEIGMPVTMTFVERGAEDAKQTFLAFEPA
ncbi:MAG: Zn-ribbon domain-containing OB-fold protein [Anaerolineae bacterium]